MWNNLIQTLIGISGPFSTLCITIYSLFMVYACIGMTWFGGVINLDNINQIVTDSDGEVPEDYVYLNFNDYASGTLTLFAIMTENNWQ
mmetsp:Transcript_60238/g.82795  ORF Transcript_60238/g.82795 Transcript_60238/m.82795 type:complete len:88 (-) Transcript_60238:713-976(-)